MITPQPLSCSWQETRVRVTEGLRRYISRGPSIVELPFQFDELYFLHVLLTRYSRELRSICSSGEMVQLLARLQLLEEALHTATNGQMGVSSTLGLYERSQQLFYQLGFQYYLKITGRGDFKTTPEFTATLQTLIHRVKGYSLTYDYMIRIFCGKLGIPVQEPGSDYPAGGSREEQIYLDTHFFLVESDYFTGVSQQDNIHQLVNDCGYALGSRIGDLAAELYWALNYFGYEGEVMQSLARYIAEAYDQGVWNYGYAEERQHLHSQYSTIAALLESMKKRCETRG